jgi:hypothetical protein
MGFLSVPSAASCSRTEPASRTKANAFEQEQAEEAEKSQYAWASSLFPLLPPVQKISIESSAKSQRILTGASRGSREIAASLGFTLCSLCYLLFKNKY